MEQAQDLAQHLRDIGVGQSDIVISPLLEIAATNAPMDLIPGEGVIITSANALKFLPFPPQGQTAYCVGDTTTKLAQDVGLAAQCLGAKVDVLIADLEQKPPNRPLCYIRGECIFRDLTGQLRHAGWQVRDHIAYTQAARRLSQDARDVLSGGTGVVLPLFSARTARLLGQEDQDWNQHVAMAISENVGDVCRELGFGTIVVAKHPELTSVLDSLSSLMGDNPG